MKFRSFKAAWATRRRRLVRRWCRRLRAEESGAALIEFAIVAALLVTLMIGGMDWARFMFLRNNLLSAVRDGARAGAVRDSTSADISAVSGFVRGRIVDDSAATGGRLSISYIDTLGIALVRVRIDSFPFTRVMPLLPFAPPRVVRQVTADMRHEFN